MLGTQLLCSFGQTVDGFSHGVLQRSHHAEVQPPSHTIVPSMCVKIKPAYLLLTGWNAVSVIRSSSLKCRLKRGTSACSLTAAAHATYELLRPNRADMVCPVSPTPWI